MAGRDHTPYQCTADLSGVEEFPKRSFWVFPNVAKRRAGSTCASVSREFRFAHRAAVL
jgi:hypothetical protein